jgi:hypothetical protein
MARRALRHWPWLVVAVIVALVVGLGGFDRRTDQLRPAIVGAEIDSHNLVFVFTGATLQLTPRFTGSPEWRIEVSGSVRNPNDEALAPILGPTGNLFLHDKVSGRTAEPDSVKLGDTFRRELVPPGNTRTSLVVSFTLPGDYAPQPGIELGVAQMEHTANVVLGLNDSERNWNVDSFAPLSVLTLPLTRLPDAPK